MDNPNYVEHEVQLRMHSEQFKVTERKFESLEGAIYRLDTKLDYGLRHIDNKFMLMFTLILGSIWFPAIMHYLHLL
jgi:hypothetical protein